MDIKEKSGFEQNPSTEELEENVRTYLLDKLPEGERNNLIRILLLLKQETPFLIEDKVEENISSGNLNENESFDMRNNSILKSLGITNIEHMELLID